MSVEEDGSARSLIDAAVLHASVACLHDVNAPDCMLAAQPVQLAHEVCRRELLAINAHGDALLETKHDVLWLVRRLFHWNCQHMAFLWCLLPWILQRIAFKADVQQVAVH